MDNIKTPDDIFWIDFASELSLLREKERQKLPYNFNVIEELHANENANTRILLKLLSYNTSGEYVFLKSFISMMSHINGVSFTLSQVFRPKIEYNKENIDGLIEDSSKQYAIIIENVSNVYGVSEESAKNLLNILIFEIINSGALITGTDFDIGPSERNYIFYSEYQKFITDLKSNNKNSQLVTNWLPTQKNNASKTFYKTNKLYYTMKYLNCNEEKAYEFLKNYYQYLTEPQFGNEYLLVDPNKEKNSFFLLLR